MGQGQVKSCCASKDTRSGWTQCVKCLETSLFRGVACAGSNPGGSGRGFRESSAYDRTYHI